MTPDASRDELIEAVVAFGRAELDDGSDQVERFIRQYYAQVPLEDLRERQPSDLFGAALSHRSLGYRRPGGAPLVRVFAPDPDEDGWQSTHTAIDIVTDDMPFLVDSVTRALAMRDLTIHSSLHPVMRVRRNGDGELIEVLAPGHADETTSRHRPSGPSAAELADRAAGIRAESFHHIEVDRQPHQAFEAWRSEILDVLADVRSAVEDWGAMRQKSADLADAIEREAPPVPEDELVDTVALLRWMTHNRFTFVGYREYELREEDGTGDDILRVVPGTGLGVLRSGTTTSSAFDRLTPLMRERAHEPNLLLITKANARSTVHRPSRLDYIGVKRFDEKGAVVGERRFIGLFAKAATNASVFDVPVVRRKAEYVVGRSGFPLGGHSMKTLEDILETYPRDELFQLTREELFENAMGILRLQERQRVRLFLRVDVFERFVSCLVYVPRDRYTTSVRLAMADILMEDLGGTNTDFTVRVGEEPLARLQFIVHTVPGHLPAIDPRATEERLADATRSWLNDLYDELQRECGEERGIALFHAFADGLPAAYREDYPVQVAAADLQRLDALGAGDDLAMRMYRPPGAPDTVMRLKLYRRGMRVSLTDVLPIIENMGVTVVDERPYAISTHDGESRWIYDFGLVLSSSAAERIDHNRSNVLDALGAVWRGQAENDGFNRLVLETGASWREVTVLRAYRRYLRQIGSTFSQSYTERTLAAHPTFVRMLLALFDARCNPDRPVDGDAGRQADIDALALQVDAALELIDSLDEDRILRGFFLLVQATLRTNFYQVDADGRPKPYLALKLDPSLLPDVPAPRPMFEVFVHSPRVEGAHLRGGRVARGGIRWSERPEDFRTEILGLMKAQLVKNSVIVPMGAKGGFVVKHMPPADDRAAQQQEVTACYRTFICGLLDLTDNLVDGVAVPPDRVVRHDGDDTYLVVAADKGTAAFSDIANALSADYGFWLGDAFASGGSAGYDHKKLGITARGAWESVKRHFRRLGVDVQSDDFTAVGIGDMSGDVFGNGMLLSRHTRLVAAFDHRHIFIDPDPDAAASHAERERLFSLPRSSWDDYDRSVLSTGGGVHPRTLKSIPLSAEARRALDVTGDAMAPPDLIRAILRAPVDLLWNGGIGTYVKAGTESNADVGDKANDAIRVDGSELRCRVVGEGGNLGFTQRGRVEYALQGGLVFTDAIDNAGGVDCSDHEVNIKILLDAVVRAGELAVNERDGLLIDMADSVVAGVVSDNYAQVEALTLAEAQAGSLVDVHGRYIASLEREERLDRALEFLPSPDELVERRARGQGLATPELAILLAYTKVSAAEQLLQSDLPDDPWLVATLEAYFPPVLRARFPDRLRAHPLRREIIATCVSNLAVNHGGTSFLHRLSEESGAPWATIIGCHLVAHEVCGMAELWQLVESLDATVPMEVQVDMLLSSRRLVERMTRWLLLNRPQPLDISCEVERFGPGVRTIADALPQLLRGRLRDRFDVRVAALVDLGVPPVAALTVASTDAMFPAFDIVTLGGAAGCDVRVAAAAYFTLDHELEFAWLREHIDALPRDDQWRALARAALRAELLGHQRAIVEEVVVSRDGRSGGDPSRPAGIEYPDVDVDGVVAASIARWIERHADGVERYRRLRAEVGTGAIPDLAMVSVALRAVKDLAPARTR